MMNTAEIRESRKRYNSVSGLVSETARLDTSRDMISTGDSEDKNDINVTSNVKSRKSSMPPLLQRSQKIGTSLSTNVIDIVTGSIHEISDEEDIESNNIENQSFAATTGNKSSKVKISEHVDIINNDHIEEKEDDDDDNDEIEPHEVKKLDLFPTYFPYIPARGGSTKNSPITNEEVSSSMPLESQSSGVSAGVAQWGASGTGICSSARPMDSSVPELKDQKVVHQKSSALLQRPSLQDIKSGHLSTEIIELPSTKSQKRSSIPGLFSAFRSSSAKSANTNSTRTAEDSKKSDKSAASEQNINTIDNSISTTSESQNKSDDDEKVQVNLDPSEGFMSKFEASPLKDLQGPIRSLQSNLTTGQSGWGDCRNLINEYGYTSGMDVSQQGNHLNAFKPTITSNSIKNKSLEISEKEADSHESEIPPVPLDELNANNNGNLNELDYNTGGTSRPYSMANTVVHHEINESPNHSGATSLNGIYSGASIGMASKLGLTSNNWRLGDVDALARVSSKEGKPLTSFFVGNDGVTGTGNIVNESSSLPMAYSKPIQTPKSTNSKETDKERIGLSSHKGTSSNRKVLQSPTGKNQNAFDFRWLSLALGLLLMASIVVNSLLVYHNWTLNRGSRDTVFNYFGSLSNDDRNKMMTQLAGFYNVNVSSIRPNIIDRDYQSTPIIDKEIRNNYTLTNDTRSNVADEKFKRPTKKLRSELVNASSIESLMNNPRLHQLFYGLSYAPRGVVEPLCGCSEEEVILDLIVLSQVTTRLRTYGTQCNQAEYVLKAIDYLNINMTLSLGVWIGSDDYINWKQINDMKRLVNQYPRHYFDSIFIGNEVLFRAEKTTPELIYYVKETKDYLYQLGYIDLPVGTSEIGSLLNEDLVKSCDFIGANVHPFFSGSEVQEAVQWTINYSRYQLEPIRDDSRKETELIISEVGWPSGGGIFMNAKAGSQELQHFLNEWICMAKADEIAYFFFEAFDEPWKKIWHEEGKKWETQWGVFTSNRELKEGIVLPNC